MHLSLLPQQVRYGFLGKVHWAVLEACDITRGGGIVLTSARGRLPDLRQRGGQDPHRAQRLALAATCWACTTSSSPWTRPPARRSPSTTPSDRIGSPVLVVDRSKMVGVVRTNQPDETSPFSEPTPETRQIGANVADFLVERDAGGADPAVVPAAAVGRGRHRQLGAGRHRRALRDPGLPDVHRGAAGLGHRPARVRALQLRLDLLAHPLARRHGAGGGEPGLLPPAHRAAARRRSPTTPRSCGAWGSSP